MGRLMELTSGPVEIKGNTPREMTARELLLLLKEAEDCFWKGYEAAINAEAARTSQELEHYTAERNKWEDKGREVKAKISAEGFDVDCSYDGIFWFLHEKEVE